MPGMKEPTHPWSGNDAVSRDIQHDLFLLQQKAGARNHAIFKTGRGAQSGTGKITPLIDNFPAGGAASAKIIGIYGEQLANHLEQSTLPLMWNGTEDANTAETPDMNHFVARLKERLLPFSGIAFPVKLGAAGNGYVVFTSAYLDLNADVILDLHTQAVRVLVALLQSDVRYSKATELLSEREIACLQMAGDGLTSEEVAEKLGLSVHTVNAYLGAATTKLDSVNRIQAIAKAIRLGYIN
ncbi:LuxR C-terminal-related transcriptional regulator [Rhizobium sp. L1K21]|uniref:LuxR C-terminal-related transcriptional regulator n=1 Tax=Rhizobium sp. L1K21 TaxID=2954933 RepID=UPI002092C327|nr:LuxR C-terminal-related transcriptional regulator [Rhizobium sp. L1K21]MCO6187138.1 LuxR C-terminal-related transcriptional regulator [Rhizobium sp. L1K21]